MRTRQNPPIGGFSLWVISCLIELFLQRLMWNYPRPTGVTDWFQQVLVDLLSNSRPKVKKECAVKLAEAQDDPFSE